MHRTHRSPASLELAGDGLALDDAEYVLNGQIERLTLSSSARQGVERSRRCVEELLAGGATLYGVNTGFGKLSNRRVEPADVLALQANLLRSHAVGFGPWLSIPESRLALVLRVQALAKGYSGVTAGLIDTLIDLYN